MPASSEYNHFNSRYLLAEYFKVTNLNSLKLYFKLGASGINSGKRSVINV